MAEVVLLLPQAPSMCGIFQNKSSNTGMQMHTTAAHAPVSRWRNRGTGRAASKRPFSLLVDWSGLTQLQFPAQPSEIPGSAADNGGQGVNIPLAPTHLLVQPAEQELKQPATSNSSIHFTADAHSRRYLRCRRTGSGRHTQLRTFTLCASIPAPPPRPVQPPTTPTISQQQECSPAAGQGSCHRESPKAPASQRRSSAGLLPLLGFAVSPGVPSPRSDGLPLCTTATPASASFQPFFIGAATPVEGIPERIFRGAATPSVHTPASRVSMGACSPHAVYTPMEGVPERLSLAATAIKASAPSPACLTPKPVAPSPMEGVPELRQLMVQQTPGLIAVHCELQHSSTPQQQQAHPTPTSQPTTRSSPRAESQQSPSVAQLQSPSADEVQAADAHTITPFQSYSCTLPGRREVVLQTGISLHNMPRVPVGSSAGSHSIGHARPPIAELPLQQQQQQQQQQHEDGGASPEQQGDADMHEAGGDMASPGGAHTGPATPVGGEDADDAYDGDDDYAPGLGAGLSTGLPSRLCRSAVPHSSYDDMEDDDIEPYAGGYDDDDDEDHAAGAQGAAASAEVQQQAAPVAAASGHGLHQDRAGGLQGASGPGVSYACSQQLQQRAAGADEDESDDDDEEEDDDDDDEEEEEDIEQQQRHPQVPQQPQAQQQVDDSDDDDDFGDAGGGGEEDDEEEEASEGDPAEAASAGGAPFAPLSFGRNQAQQPSQQQPSQQQQQQQQESEEEEEEEEEENKADPAPSQRRGNSRRSEAHHVREGNMYRSRKSLAGAGLVIDEEIGVRRSSRARMRPLEFWRNEKKVYSRNHRTMPTVVSVETRTPNPQWPAEGTAKVKKQRARTKRS